MANPIAPGAFRAHALLARGFTVLLPLLGASACGDESSRASSHGGATGSHAGAATAGSSVTGGAGGSSAGAGAASSVGGAGTAGASAGEHAGGTPGTDGHESGGQGGSSGGAVGGASTIVGGAGVGGSGGAAGTSQSAGGGGMAAGASGAGGAPASGGAGKAAAGSGSTEPYPNLRFSGLTTAVELAPLRVAVNGLYPATVTIGSGGVDTLCGANPTADVATNAETQLLRVSATAGCSNLRIIFTVCEGLYRIVGKKSSGLTTLADLAGKKVMASSGTSSAYFLSLMLDSVGLTAGSGAGQVQIISGTPGAGTFSGGNAPDAATIWEPGIEQAKEALGSDAVEFQHDASGTQVYRELFDLHSSTEVLADPVKRRGIVRLVQALIAASQQITDDPSVAWPVLTGPSGVSQAVLEQSMKYERYAGTLVPDLLDVLEAEEPWRAAIDNRTPRNRSQLATLIDDTVLRDALAGQ